jgi:ABC-type dipeptide/oligopeptide/nickel transport system permease subunit
LPVKAASVSESVHTGEQQPGSSQAEAGSPPEVGTLRVAGLWLRSFRQLRRNRGAMLGFAIVLLMIFVAVSASWLAPHDPNKLIGGKFEPPGREFPLGTDNLGRDILSRLMYGSRASIGAAAVATIVISILGISIGSLAGYLGGWVDSVLMRIVDVLLAFPSLILALAIVGVLGPGLTNMLIAVTIIAWAGYARLVRGYILQVREQPYIQAATALGAGSAFIIRRHIIPNIISPVLVLATLDMGILILTIAALSFLGLGIQPPDAEWGAMLNQGRDFFQRAPQLMIYPGLMICLTVLGFNLLGDGLRDALDPRHTQ